MDNAMSFLRYRDQNGDLSLKYGNILMRTFRQYYGPAFGKGCGDNADSAMSYGSSTKAR
jgi:hypothetical protein